MPNYGAFTQICVLWEFREKKLESKKKQQMGLKIRASTDLPQEGSADCLIAMLWWLRQKECGNKAVKFCDIK